MSERSPATETLDRVYDFNEVANACGYFTTAFPVNNGYGCRHPEQSERVDGFGCCMCDSCPFAVELDPEEPEDVAFMQADGMSGEETGWVRLSDPEGFWKERQA